MMRKSLLLYLLFFGSLAVNGQDSLQQFLRMATNPVAGDLPTAIQAARKCIEQSDPTISPDLHFQCRFALARNYYDLGQPWEAERTILPAIDFARSQNRKERRSQRHPREQLKRAPQESSLEEQPRGQKECRRAIWERNTRNQSNPRNYSKEQSKRVM